MPGISSPEAPEVQPALPTAEVAAEPAAAKEEAPPALQSRLQRRSQRSAADGGLQTARKSPRQRLRPPLTLPPYRSISCFRPCRRTVEGHMNHAITLGSFSGGQVWVEDKNGSFPASKLV